MNIKNKDFIFIGSNSSLAKYSIAKFSKNNSIFGTFNKKMPENSKNFNFLEKVDLSKNKQIESETKTSIGDLIQEELSDSSKD